MGTCCPHQYGAAVGRRVRRSVLVQTSGADYAGRNAMVCRRQNSLAQRGNPSECVVPDQARCITAESNRFCLTEIQGSAEMRKKMKNKLEQIKEKAIAQLNGCDTADKLNELRVSVLGKKGELTDLLKSMRDVAPEERPRIGQMVNEARSEIEKLLEERKTKIERAVREAKMKAEVIDVTLPAKKAELGHRHPDTIVLEEVERIFVGMGYEVVEGPEVEKDYYNFEALNIPADHPAKDEQDTFYITGDILLRTQTSGVQVHEMEKGKLPIRMIAPGRVFRSDEVDATHSPCFHQIEGLVIDRNITFADLKGTLAVFARELFGEETKVKFRPHHFPFTEPSAEMDVTCFKCGGKGCRFCKGSGWIEILGCGMVHPHVLEMSGIADGLQNEQKQ